MDLLEVLNWRYAVKKYNKGLVVSNEKLQEIIQAISLSASSTGLQPYRIFLINNSEIKQVWKILRRQQICSINTGYSTDRNQIMKKGEVF